MCANYQPITRENIVSILDIDTSTLPEYGSEAWPGSLCPILIANDVPHVPGQLMLAQFGLVPHWSKDTSIHRHTYNARSETVASKPSYRSAWKAHRYSLVLVQSFYEPCYETGKPVRWRIHRADNEPFTLGGIWEAWNPPGTRSILYSFSMLTINATDHPLMQRFHRPDDEKRSIVVIPPEKRAEWLMATAAQAMNFLQPMPEGEFTSEAAPLSKRKKTLSTNLQDGSQ